MGLRSLTKVICILAATAVILCIVTLVRDATARSARTYESTFLPLVNEESLEAKDITTVEVSLPEQEEEVRWRYKRVDGLWRLPDFAGVFALNGEVDNLVTMLLTGRVRPVGYSPEDDARYGLLAGSTINLTLFKDTTEVLRLRVGVLRPGAAKDERYVIRDKDNAVYLFNSNPAVFFADQEPPTMLDKHILPLALPHAFPARISWRGTRSMELREVSIRALPVDRTRELANPTEDKNKDKKKDPTHEFTGTYSSGAKKLLDDSAGMSYVNKVIGLEFDKIVGSVSPVQVEYQKFDDPLVEVTFHYDNANPISLAVSSSLVEGKYPILNRASGQVFIVSSEKVDSLMPNVPVK